MEIIYLSFMVSGLVQFIFGSLAITQRSDQVTDLSYSVTFIALALLNLYLVDSPSPLLVVVNIGVILWGIRLGYYLFKRISKIGKDARFDGIREAPMKFFSFWFFQAISVPFIMIPVSVLASAETSGELTSISYIFIVSWMIGLLVETVADQQKFDFKNDPDNAGKWVDVGLWKHSRHPNYFGELLMWWSIFGLVVTELGYDAMLTVVGPIYISFIILFVTGIPTLKRRYDKKFAGDPKYEEYKKETRLLLPLPKFISIEQR